VAGSGPWAVLRRAGSIILLLTSGDRGYRVKREQRVIPREAVPDDVREGDRLDHPPKRGSHRLAGCLRGPTLLLLLLAAPIASATPATYRNPLVRDVADPFVLKYRGEYYLYRTEVRGELDVMTSRDLVHWRPGPAVWRPNSPQAENAHNIWAPEVYYENGRFYLYFAASGPGGGQYLWRARSDSPTGPFRTDPAGPVSDPWRIDATLFRDDDGAWYLYGCHRLTTGAGGAQVEGCRIADPWGGLLSDWLPMVVPRAPWEGIWVEAPTVLKARLGYYLLYSGPDAESPKYEIGYATAASPLGPWHKQGILVPNTAAAPGPGHQGVVLAPDNLTPYLVYHRKRLAERDWNRDLMLDRLWMGNGRLATRAPTMSPQPLPPRPVFEDHFDSEASRRSWSPVAGDWSVDAAAHEWLQRDASTRARGQLTARAVADGVIEVNLRRRSGEGAVGLALIAGGARFPVTLYSQGRNTLDLGPIHAVPLPAGLDPQAYHQLLLTRRGADVAVKLDGRPMGHASFGKSPARLELVTERASAAFSGIAVTPYTEALPLGPPEPTVSGWRRKGDGIEQRFLGAEPQRYVLSTRLTVDGAVSARIQGWALGTSLPVRKYGIQLQAVHGSERIEAYIDPANNVLATHGWAGGLELPWQNSDLPLRFDYTAPHVLTVQRRGRRWRIAVDGGSDQERVAALPGSVAIVLITEDARASFRDPEVVAARSARRK
jgi:GH43 family beta-xylosidase